MLALGDPSERDAVLALARALQLPRPAAELEPVPEAVEAVTEEESGTGLYDDPWALVRYLRAREWDLTRAEEMIRGTARWRRDYKLAAMRSGAYADVVAGENAQGTAYVRGFDRRGRPLVVIKCRNTSSTDYEGIVRHFVYNMERAVAFIDRQKAEGKLVGDINDHNSTKLVLLIDFNGCGMSNMVPLSTAREVIRIMQDNFPERLAMAFVIDAPWVLTAFFNAIWPFVDPVTREKAQFVSEEGEARSQRMAKFFDLALLEEEYGGLASEPFDSRIFLQAAKPLGAVFGLELNEQLAMVRSGAVTLPNEATTCKAANAPIWQIFSDPRVLALPKKERAIVRELARTLAEAPPQADLETAGLFDNVGALVRYLRSCGWDAAEAEQRLRGTARWRKEFGLQALLAGAHMDALERENAGGRMYVRGFDRSSRPVIVVTLRRADLNCHSETLLHMIYCIERAVACLDVREHETYLRVAGTAGIRSSAEDELEADTRRADGKFTVLVNFAGYSQWNRPKLRTVREVMRMLQDHYPERLGCAILVNPPAQVRAMWRVVYWLIAPDIRQKVVVVSCPKEEVPNKLDVVFDRATLERILGTGTADAEPFDSAIFLHTQAAAGGAYGVEFDAQLAHARASGTNRLTLASSSAQRSIHNHTRLAYCERCCS